jgi:hypothetical protein
LVSVLMLILCIINDPNSTLPINRQPIATDRLTTNHQPHQPSIIVVYALRLMSIIVNVYQKNEKDLYLHTGCLPIGQFIFAGNGIRYSLFKWRERRVLA